MALLLAALVGTGGAQAEAAPDYNAARRHFQAGTQLYREGRYPDAAREFESAYAIVRDPVLLFNIGQAYEKAGDKQRAIDNYEAYLSQSPKAQDRTQVGARIESLRRELAATITLPPAQGGERRPESYERIADDGSSIGSSSGLRIAGWVTLAVGVAGLATGLGLGLVARSKGNDVGAQSRIPGKNFGDLADVESQAKTLEKGAYVAYGVGGAAAIAGIVMLAVDARRRSLVERQVSVRPLLAPRLGGVAAVVRF